jgi:hypothetical protein
MIEIRHELLNTLLLAEELELFVIHLGLRRARPLALPAPRPLELPAPGGIYLPTAAPSAPYSTALITLPQPTASTSTEDLIWLAAWVILLVAALPACMSFITPEEDGRLLALSP